MSMIEVMKAMMNKSEYTFDDLSHSQNLKLPEIKPQDLSGQTIIVTGANAGLGLEIAKSIASMNPALLILACRNPEKAQTAAASVQEGNKTKIEVETLDLASFASVKAFASKFLARNIPLDRLVSNAGVASQKWELTNDGYEITAQVNHLSNVLLVLLLTPALKKAPKSRVVVVASDVHFWASRPTAEDPTPIKTLLTEPANLMFNQYPATKLMNVLFANEYAKRNPHKNILICSCNPGYTTSELGAKEASGANVGKPHEIDGMPPKRTTYEGAKTLIDCSVMPHEELKNGGYYTDMKESRKRTIATGEVGEKFADRVWKDTIEILSKVAGEGSFEEWARK